MVSANTKLGIDANSQLSQAEQSGSSTSLMVEMCLKYFTLLSNTKTHWMLRLSMSAMVEIHIVTKEKRVRKELRK